MSVIHDNEGKGIGKENPLPVNVTGSYVRKSTDTPPEGKEGETLYLWDTKKAYIHDGTDWRLL